MTFIISLIALILGIVNLCYLIFKDKRAMVDADKKECIKVLKYVFKKSVKNRQDKTSNMIIPDAYVNALKHLRLIKIKKKEEVLSNFALKVNHYNEGSLNDEDLIGSFTETIDSVYNLELSLKEYFSNLITILTS
ncbi:hypothetical protein LS68_008045 [Helicobacter sp. MIT 05-5293]|uniref:hypothetical protein n=1 Tax=Helicobacter sp. MIT 05-5293 TaxID=1548149 RepID=UPI00051D15BD|nr:hypothetical protein [Helicobacter sp. MIT 05-5293]TLD80159.1 hypothetical protein LS68_008045 [Helicobacter sp. MIT 05-5293]